MTRPSLPSGTPDLTRRRVIRGAMAGGLAAPLLAACGEDAEPADGPAGEADSTPTSEAPPPPDEEGGGGGGGGGSEVLASTGDVPVGGGVVLGEQEVVVTQPTKGDFKAFTAVCTHQGCIVASVAGGTISCGCHGSQFSAEDGSVTGGPATGDLAPVKISVQGSDITRG
jgi:Rieske Fe-S protein